MNDFLRNAYEKVRSNKKLQYGLIAALIIIILFALGAGKKGGPRPGKNEYGFKSTFSDDYSEEGKLKNFPIAKEEMLKAEEKILDSGLKVRKAAFSQFGMKGTFYLGKDEEAYDSIILEFGKKEDSEDWELFSITAKIFDDNMYNQAKKALCAFAGLSDEEAKLVDEVGTTYKEDGIQTMKYYIDYAERNEDGDRTENSEEVKYKELTFSKEEVDEEIKTTLAQVKRQQNRPKADGEDFDQYGLALYIPNGFTANPYNGMLYVWDYYTGSYVGNYPDGIDINIKINGLKEGKTFDEYVRNDSRPAKSAGVTPFEVKNLNGHDWYTCNNGKIYYYGAEFMGNTYEIEVRDGKTYNGITLQTALEMLEKTLFFE